ncbi:uncharacterized protein F4822DRAFT_393242 [Hypoxylon trugodes]|uniref:uncharacterized protein n=1 Tax=Hypoxylon trugodes TaxID=326681 RepID=UPI00219855A3|nr:uncharacterized protein F4822DRAFT_393242 [Hypoxylon trugodes]KAI1390469.1 hypothetical protein F4822DRAFT_393242 [Hypoxylon trugodes]
MLTRVLRRALILGLLSVLLFYTILRYIDGRPVISHYRVQDWIKRTFPTANNLINLEQQHTLNGPVDSGSKNGANSDISPQVLPGYNENGDNIVDGPNFNDTHVVLFSVSTPDNKYFKLRFDDKLGINPNIIPHPLLEDTWTIVAQQHDPADITHTQFTEMVCDASFNQDSSELSCLFPPVPLPIVPTGLGKCEGELEYVNLNTGPHDARVFYGPVSPFIIYGSNSQWTCFGQWMQDFRALINWEREQQSDQPFQLGTELHRPMPYFPMEKNWFLFWDTDGRMYAHYDVSPHRVFAALEVDASVASDLAPLAAAAGDGKCMEKYMPKTGPSQESIHQATNSLSITMCRQTDPECSPSDANTFIFTIFQHKTFYNFHSVYEPYVMVFSQMPPFQIYGISQKPLWIYGRDTPDRMFYVTSMNWKKPGQKYHGYLDDILFVAFGIEDSDTAGIDVLVGDIFTDLGLCSGMAA